MLFIDHQIGLMAGVRDFSSLAEYKSNVVGLARAAKALKMPVLISSSNAQWQKTRPSATPSRISLAPFNHNLSEYGFVLQNFSNNANQHAVPDPFGMVK
jgi:hypothetical protein